MKSIFLTKIYSSIRHALKNFSYNIFFRDDVAGLSDVDAPSFGIVNIFFLCFLMQINYVIREDIFTIFFETLWLHKYIAYLNKCGWFVIILVYGEILFPICEFPSTPFFLFILSFMIRKYIL